MVNIINEVNGAVWGVPTMIVVIGMGIYLSFGTGFVQIRKFGFAMKTTFGKMFAKDENGTSMTPFQAVCTALAATVGTGNIAGVAGAIAIGGPGAVFWMWCSALLGMCTKFAEVTLAVHFRERNERGELAGGPMYFIKNGLGKKWNWMAVLYAMLGMLAVLGIGNTTQTNTMADAISGTLSEFNLVSAAHAGTVKLIVGVAVALLAMLVLLGGVKRLGDVTEKLVPFMAMLYIIMGLGVIIVNINRIPAVFVSIFKGAFTPAGITGGAAGSFIVSMKKGVARGIFSNEAGMGTGSIAHACAETDHPVRQGMYGIFEVFADTLVICTLTALVILCSGTAVPYGTEIGAELTVSAFSTVYGRWASLLTTMAICCFAFSTIIGWGLYGCRFLEFICHTDKVVKPYLLFHSLVCIAGAVGDLGIIWKLADTFNGLMMIPNLTALLLLSPVVFRLTKEFFAKE